MPETRLTIPNEAITLEGILQTPPGEGPFAAVVLSHPHPRYGGDMHNNVVMACAQGLLRRGIAVLRFNFRGVGRSGGQYDEGRGERTDLQSALALAGMLPEIDGDHLGLVGYSFGAMMATAAATADVAVLALVALPLSMPGDPRATLADYPHPLLLLAGDRDHVCPAAELQQLGEALGPTTETRIVAGADHFWGGYEHDIEQIIGDFAACYLLTES